MKKLAVLLAIATALVMAFSVAALAKDAHMCVRNPCTGTRHGDNLWEKYYDAHRDVILGKGGNDRLHAETNNRDRDVLKGQNGRDILNVRDGDERDTVNGGRGYDHCKADSYREIGTGCEGVNVP